MSVGANDELCVDTICSFGTPLIGPLSVGSSFDVPLKVTPRTLGRRVYDVTFTTNGSLPNTQTVRVRLDVSP